MLKFIRFLFRRKQPPTFTFGAKKVAVLTGSVGGEHAIILVPRGDATLTYLETSGERTTDVSRFKGAVVLKFPTEAQAAVVAQGMIREYADAT